MLIKLGLGSTLVYYRLQVYIKEKLRTFEPTKPFSIRLFGVFLLYLILAGINNLLLSFGLLAIILVISISMVPLEVFVESNYGVVH